MHEVLLHSIALSNSWQHNPFFVPKNHEIAVLKIFCKSFLLKSPPKRTMFGAIALIVAQVMNLAFVRALTPLIPAGGYTYVIEAVRAQSLPNCRFRYLSHLEAPGERLIDFWSEQDNNQFWQVIDSNSGDGSFYVMTRHQTYMSYLGTCNDPRIELSPSAGNYQRFKFITVENNILEYYIQAVGRLCSDQYVGFPVNCVDYLNDRPQLWNSAGQNQRFRFLGNAAPSVLPTSQPSKQPTTQPSVQPSSQPIAGPTSQPSKQPTTQPSVQPSRKPSNQPSRQPTYQPISQPTCQPTCQPLNQPSEQPSCVPTLQPSGQQLRHPVGEPSNQHTAQPSSQQTMYPSTQSSKQPTRQPSADPTSVSLVSPSEPLVSAGVIIGSVLGGLVVGVLVALWWVGKLPFVGAASPG